MEEFVTSTRELKIMTFTPHEEQAIANTSEPVCVEKSPRCNAAFKKLLGSKCAALVHPAVQSRSLQVLSAVLLYRSVTADTGDVLCIQKN